MKAEDCKKSFYSNMFFFRNEKDVVFVNKDKANYKDFPNIEESDQFFKKRADSNQEIFFKEKNEKSLKPSKKKEDQKNPEETKITLEKWKSLPDSLRNLILMRNSENPSEINEVEMPKYLTKFNKTQYKLKRQNMNEEKKMAQNKKNENFEEGKNNMGLTGFGILDGDLKRDYGAYRGDKGMNAWMRDSNDKMNIFNYIDSREWSNNF